jgi:hypothetical protein
MPKMKNTLLLAAFIACAVSAPIAPAQDRHVPAMAMDMERMKAMQAQMETIRIVTDPEVRQRLMQDHMQAMEDCMKDMRGMGGPAMQGGMMKQGMNDGEMMKHHAMLEHRMDMMQMMMEQMMQHEQMMQPMPAQ